MRDEEPGARWSEQRSLQLIDTRNYLFCTLDYQLDPLGEIVTFQLAEEPVRYQGVQASEVTGLEVRGWARWESGRLLESELTLDVRVRDRDLHRVYRCKRLD